jgi:Niemann-Pick C1 protein
MLLASNVKCDVCTHLCEKHLEIQKYCIVCFIFFIFGKLFVIGTGGGKTQPAFPDMCPMVNIILANTTGPGTICFESHLLELWAEGGNFSSASDTAVSALDDQAVLNIINNPSVSSKLTGRVFSVESQLGKTIKDSKGKIVSAKALMMVFISDGSDNKIEVTKEWEKKFVDVILKFSKDELETIGGGYKAVPLATRSFKDISGDDIQSDLSLFIFGYILVFCFVMLMIGKFNLVESRPFLSIIGIICVGMGIISTYGVCGVMGIPYTNMNSILPFLLLGIGIDDMFVIVQSFDNLRGDDLPKNLPARFGQTMRHAGVAITITSVTDLLAFGVGGSTVIPALRSFCIHAALGIVFVFLYMITFFFGWFYLDQKRIESDRNFVICCYRHKEYVPNACSQKPVQKMAFEKLAALLVKWPAKLIVIIVTVGQT